MVVAVFSLQNNEIPIQTAQDGIHRRLLVDENQSIDSLSVEKRVM